MFMGDHLYLQGMLCVALHAREEEQFQIIRSTKLIFCEPSISNPIKESSNPPSERTDLSAVSETLLQETF